MTDTCAAAGSADIVDASVVVGAMVRSDLVVTSDPGDLGQLRDALGATPLLQPI